ncbi:MAG TPA: hypothetical protein VF170_13050, partial [Planctomycetaceae bacterium]
ETAAEPWSEDPSAEIASAGSGDSVAVETRTINLRGRLTATGSLEVIGTAARGDSTDRTSHGADRPVRSTAPLLILVCPHCRTRVAVTDAGECPSCRKPVTGPSPHEAAEVTDFGASDDAELEARAAIEDRNRRSHGAVKRARGIALLAVGFLILPAGACFPVNWLLAGAAFYFAAKAIDEGRRLMMRSAWTALRRDPRPPILFLRSFRDDGSFARPNPLLAAALTIHPLGRLNRRQTHEEKLAAALRHLGPVVAVGRPGEQLPELGAHRMYLDDGRWQSKVTELMDRARLVVLRVGGSAGVQWELREAVRLLSPDRLILYQEPPGPLSVTLAGQLPVRSESLPQDFRYLYFGEGWIPAATTSLHRVLRAKSLPAFGAGTVAKWAAAAAMCAALVAFVYLMVLSNA